MSPTPEAAAKLMNFRRVKGSITEPLFRKQLFMEVESFTSLVQSGYWPFSVTSTIRKRAFAAIIRSYASRALDRVMTSVKS